MKIFTMLFFFLSASLYPATEAQNNELVAKLIKAVKDGDDKLFQEAFNVPKFTAAVEKLLDEEYKIHQQIIANGVSGFLGNLAKRLSVATKSGSFEFLHTVKRPTGTYWLFRMDGSNGLNYYEFQFIEENGILKVGDMYVYIVGQFMSEVLARTFNSIMNKGVDAKANGIKVYAITEKIKAQEFEAALLLFQKLPEKLKQIKLFKTMKMQIVQNLSEDLYIDAIDDLMKHFGKTDKGYISLIQVDYWFMKKKFKKAIKCINDLDDYLQGDPYLDFIRVTSYYSLQDFANTLKYSKRYITNFIDDGSIVSQPFFLAIELKDYDKAAIGLDLVYQNEFTIDIEKDPEYKEFVKSPAYKKFKKKYKISSE